MSRRPLILLLLLTALVYSQHVWTAQYVYEDSQTMQFEPIYVQVTTTGDINPAHVQRMHWGDVPPFATLAWSNLLPSRWASRVTWELAADNNPRAQHVVNLIVHLVNGSLVWLLAEAVFGVAGCLGFGATARPALGEGGFLRLGGTLVVALLAGLDVLAQELLDAADLLIDVGAGL